MAKIKLINRIAENGSKEDNGYLTFSVLPFEYQGSIFNEIKIKSRSINEKLFFDRWSDMEGQPLKYNHSYGKPTFTGKCGKGTNVISLDDSDLEKEGNVLKIMNNASIKEFKRLDGKVRFCFKVTSRKSDEEVNIELHGQPEDNDTFNPKIIPIIKVLREKEYFGRKQKLVPGQEYILESFWEDISWGEGTIEAGISKLHGTYRDNSAQANPVSSETPNIGEKPNTSSNQTETGNSNSGSSSTNATPSQLQAVGGFTSLSEVNYYNSLYYHGGYHALKKYNELYNKFVGVAQDYYQTSLRSKIDEIFNQAHQEREFLSIFDNYFLNRNESKILSIKQHNEAELLKREKTMKLVVEMLAEMEKTKKPSNQQEEPGSSSTPSQEGKLDQLRRKAISEIGDAFITEPVIYNSDLSPENREWRFKIGQATSEKEINLIKEAVLIEVGVKRSLKKQGTSLEEVLRKGQDNLQNLEETLNKISEAMGTKNYEQRVDELKELEQDLAKSNLREYKKAVEKLIDQELAKYEINSEDLDSHTQEQLTKLKSGTITDEKDLVKTKNSVLDFIKFKGAIVKVDKLIKKAEDLLKRSVFSEIKKLRKDIRTFISTDSTYHQNAYQEKKDEVQAAIRKLENFSGQRQTQDQDISLWKIVLPIGLGAVVIIALVLFVKGRKKKEKILKVK